jgi:hypothetical protein
MAMPAAAMTGCWPSAASPELSYSHHGKKKYETNFSDSFSRKTLEYSSPFSSRRSSWELVSSCLCFIARTRSSMKVKKRKQDEWNS